MIISSIEDISIVFYDQEDRWFFSFMLWFETKKCAILGADYLDVLVQMKDYRRQY